jgi:hypothetical protein
MGCTALSGQVMSGAWTAGQTARCLSSQAHRRLGARLYARISARGTGLRASRCVFIGWPGLTLTLRQPCRIGS